MEFDEEINEEISVSDYSEMTNFPYERMRIRKMEMPLWCTSEFVPDPGQIPGRINVTSCLN